MKQQNIETEIRSLITEQQYKKLLSFFKREGKLLGVEKQISYYFSGDVDLRIQESAKAAKIWLKKGQMHADAREEVEVKLAKQEFENAHKLFLVLGYEVKIKWFRKRNTFAWKGVQVMLDDTKGYGYILELEKMCQAKDKEKTLKMLRTKLKLLDIAETSKQEFDAKFEYYKHNWQQLVN